LRQKCIPGGPNSDSRQGPAGEEEWFWELQRQHLGDIGMEFRPARMAKAWRRLDRHFREEIRNETIKDAVKAAPTLILATFC
jgi:hypothetical protein